MSQQNVEIAQRSIEALNRRDLQELLAVCDPEVEFRSMFSAVLGGTFHGHAGIRDYFREFTDTFEEAQFELDQVEDSADLVVARLRAHGRGRASGVALDWQAVYAGRVRNGKGWRIAVCPSREQALEAVGLSE